MEDCEYKVKRATLVKVKYYNQDGQEKIESLDTLRSRVFQHEYDHLDGILVSDIGERIPSPKEKQKANKKLQEK